MSSYRYLDQSERDFIDRVQAHRKPDEQKPIIYDGGRGVGMIIHHRYSDGTESFQQVIVGGPGGVHWIGAVPPEWARGLAEAAP